MGITSSEAGRQAGIDGERARVRMLGGGNGSSIERPSKTGGLVARQWTAGVWMLES